MEELRMEKNSSKTENTKEENKHTHQVLKLINESPVMLFHDQFNVGYFAPYGNGRLLFKIRSRLCKNWINKLFYDNFGGTLSPNSIQSIIQLLESKACFDGHKIKLSVRVAEEEGTIWYDLGSSA